MDIEEWGFKRINRQASVDMWDSMAQSCGENTVSAFADNAFLQPLEKNGRKMLMQRQPPFTGISEKYIKNKGGKDGQSFMGEGGRLSRA